MNDTTETGDIITSLAPWLTVHNISKAVDFYKFAFGAVEKYRLEAPGGVLQIARLSIDGADFWLSEGAGPGAKTEAENSFRMILTFADPHTLFNRAIDAGASEIFPVGEEHGWRLGRLADPFGYHWEIGHPLKKD